MRLARTLLALPIAALAFINAQDASACGGCFIAESESTVVTGHRMIMSISPEGSTLWDQIVYSGDPSSFAWVLPVNGVVEVGLSSDALFEAVEVLTQVTVNSPTINCAPPTGCNASASGGPPDSAGSGGGGGGVTVVAQETVGPYETVQLESQDPAALQNWLASHGYNLPPEIAPIVAAYVNEGFNFLALRLVPGEGVDSMRPVRVTTPGAGSTLPLRMVAAGTGPTTPITLWTFGEGRYEPTNFPSFEIEPDQLVWDWDNSRSNYTELKAAGFAATNGMGWLIEAGEPLSKFSLEYPLFDLVEFDPENSGYTGDPANGVTPMDELMADLEKLYGGIPEGALWINRMTGELSREALADDLDMGASLSQEHVVRWFEATKTIGKAPECPPVQPCDDFPMDEGGGPLDAEDQDIWGSGGCAFGHTPTAPVAGLALAAIFALSRRRWRR